jgi:multidrug resistance efflux pump
MTGEIKRSSLVLTGVLLLAVSSACRSSTSETEARGVVIVNAPAAGQVRRVFAREGLTVREGDPLFEIVVRAEQPAAPPAREEDPQARAGRTFQAAQGEIEAARAEVVRFEVEVQRLTPLVASGDAPQAQLDGARAEFERAQRRLQQAQASAQNAQSGIATARQQSQSSAIPRQTFTEQLVTARASSAGTLSAINARVGERVTTGQPLATLRAKQ